MFSHVLENGTVCCLLLTPSNRVILRLTYSQRIYSLDITDTAYGQVLLGVHANKLNLAADMARIGQFWRGVNDHHVGLSENGQYTVACPSKGFRSKAVKVDGDRETRAAVHTLVCPACNADVSIPDHERSLYSQRQCLTKPKWRDEESASAAVAG